MAIERRKRNIFEPPKPQIEVGGANKARVAKREEELGDRRQGQILRGDGMTPRGGGVEWQMAEASRKH